MEYKIEIGDGELPHKFVVVQEGENGRILRRYNVHQIRRREIP